MMNYADSNYPWDDLTVELYLSNSLECSGQLSKFLMPWSHLRTNSVVVGPRTAKIKNHKEMCPYGSVLNFYF